MKKGKATCRALKDIRHQIARENEIDYTPPECTHEGDCSGTCPQCESEVQYLERQLARRRALGKAVAIIGLAAATAMPVIAEAQECVKPADDQRMDVRGKMPAFNKDKIVYAAEPNETDTVTVVGVVLEKYTGHEMTEAIVEALDCDEEIFTQTDEEGRFVLRVPTGATLRITKRTYQDKYVLLDISKRDVRITVFLEDDPGQMLMGDVIAVPPTTIHDDIYKNDD